MAFTRKITKRVLEKKEPSYSILSTDTNRGYRSQIIEGKERKETSVTSEQLELLYLIDGLTGRIVDKIIEKFLSGDPPYRIKGKNKVAVEKIEAWCESIDLTYIISESIRDIHIAGNGTSWVELGYNKDWSDIPSIVTINPKNMDFIRNIKNEVIYDENLRPIGFILGDKLRPDIEWRKDSITINLNGQESVTVPPAGKDGRDCVSLFKLVGLGENEKGTSPIARGYKAALVRLNIEDVIGEVSSRSSGIVAKVGTEEQDPMEITDEQLTSVRNQFIENLDKKQIFAFRRNVELSNLPVPDIADYNDFLDYFTNLYCTSCGVKLSLLMEPERGFRGDIEIAKTEFLDLIKLYQIRIAHQIKEQFFKRLINAWGMKVEDTPSIVFQIKDSTIALSKSRRIATYFRNGSIRYDPKTEKYLRELEDLPTDFTDKLIAKWEKEGILPESEEEKNVRSQDGIET